MHDDCWVRASTGQACSPSRRPNAGPCRCATRDDPKAWQPLDLSASPSGQEAGEERQPPRPWWVPPAIRGHGRDAVTCPSQDVDLELFRSDRAIPLWRERFEWPIEALHRALPLLDSAHPTRIGTGRAFAQRVSRIDRLGSKTLKLRFSTGKHAAFCVLCASRLRREKE